MSNHSAVKYPDIRDVETLSEAVTEVATRMLEKAREQTTTGNWILGHDDVSDLISEEDYLLYFDFIASELQSREEVLDLELVNGCFDLILGLKWCPNYAPSREELEEREEWEIHGDAEISHPKSLFALAKIGLEQDDPSLLGAIKVRMEDLYSIADETGVPLSEADARAWWAEHGEEYMKELEEFQTNTLSDRMSVYVSKLLEPPVLNKSYAELLSDGDVCWVSGEEVPAALKNQLAALPKGLHCDFYCCIADSIPILAAVYRFDTDFCLNYCNNNPEVLRTFLEIKKAELAGFQDPSFCMDTVYLGENGRRGELAALFPASLPTEFVGSRLTGIDFVMTADFTPALAVAIQSQRMKEQQRQQKGKPSLDDRIKQTKEQADRENTKSAGNCGREL